MNKRHVKPGPQPGHDSMTVSDLIRNCAYHSREDMVTKQSNELEIQWLFFLKKYMNNIYVNFICLERPLINVRHVNYVDYIIHNNLQ